MDYRQVLDDIKKQGGILQSELAKLQQKEIDARKKKKEDEELKKQIEREKEGLEMLKKEIAKVESRLKEIVPDEQNEVGAGDRQIKNPDEERPMGSHK